MPKSWKETTLAALVIAFVATLLSLALWQTEKTSVAEALRTSGFVDETILTEGAIPTQESSDLIGIVGFTARQTLQIVVPLLITLRILNTTRQRSKWKRLSAA